MVSIIEIIIQSQPRNSTLEVTKYISKDLASHFNGAFASD